MADVTTITRTALRATPTTFSLHAFEEILMRMEYTATLYEDLKNVPENDLVLLERLQERAANSWVEAETAALNFLRSHTGRTAVPLLVETISALVELLDLETGEHPSLQATMDAALVRRAKSAADCRVRTLLDGALPRIFAIAKIQSEMFGTAEARVAA
ncbi:MAG: hypothetical protein ABJT31_17055 [Hyphomicrobiales bacterium]